MTEINTSHYTYRVAWSAEDGEHVATVVEFPSLSWLAPGPTDALSGLTNVVRDVVADLRRSGEPVPEPLADRAYSGKFVVRVPPELHRRLAVEAAEQKVSLNRLVSDRLATAPTQSGRVAVGIGLSNSAEKTTRASDARGGSKTLKQGLATSGLKALAPSESKTAAGRSKTRKRIALTGGLKTRKPHGGR